MKKHKVFIIEEAENDLIEIYNYFLTHDSAQKADLIINMLEKVCLGLEVLPKRGRIVPELEKINITSFLEIIHKPFRIIYQVLDNSIYVHAILDARRDLEDFLYQRLLKI